MSIYKIIAYILILGTLLGLAASFGGVFFQGILLAGIMLGAALTILIGIADISYAKKNFVYPLRMSTVLLTGLLVTLIHESHINQSKHLSAVTLIEQIEQEKSLSGTYPNALDQIETERLSEMNYRLINDEHYTLSYHLADKWHLNSYRSKTQKWTIKD